MAARNTKSAKTTRNVRAKNASKNSECGKTSSTKNCK